MLPKKSFLACSLALIAGGFLTQSVQAQTILTTSNGIVRSSLCVGTDCQSGISFSDSTIIVKENNTRIKFADTSVAASFPRNDWELEANSQTNGGPNRFSLLDCGEGSNDGGCSESINVFSVEANAGSNALYVDDGGRVGLGTGSPVVELHVVDGDTPTLRLEQNTSSGFAAQTWDVAGNETNFFIRDVTGGSALPFRSRPGAPTSSIDIAASGNVGIGTASPSSALHVNRSGASILTIQSGSSGLPRMKLDNADSAAKWFMDVSDNDDLRISVDGSGVQEFLITPAGNLTITGSITTSGSCSIGCDRVFSPDYEIPSIEEHAQAMWRDRHLPMVGPTPEGQAFNLTDKTERMLNELEKAHIYIDQLHNRLAALEAKFDQPAMTDGQ